MENLRNIFSYDVNETQPDLIEPLNDHYQMNAERDYIRGKFNEQEEIENLKAILANNVDTYLNDCRHLISEKIKNTIPKHDYHIKNFEKLSEWEILEYRYLMETDVEKGVHALNQIQLMEMLLQERKLRRFPQYDYKMGTPKNVVNIVEGLAFTLGLRKPTRLLTATHEKIRQHYQGKPYDLRETAQSKKLFELTMFSEALESVKGCSLHRDGEMGDLACRFKHLSIKENCFNNCNVFSL